MRSRNTITALEILTTAGVVRGAIDGKNLLVPRHSVRRAPNRPLCACPTCISACWSEVRDASTFGDACMQFDAQHQNLIGAEDCLTLNVWTPATALRHPGLPVMFFIHGGRPSNRGSVGNSQFGAHYMRPLVESQNVILVTANYRLGPLGYLANSALAASSPDGSTGNYWHARPIAALHWQRTISTHSVVTRHA